MQVLKIDNKEKPLSPKAIDDFSAHGVDITLFAPSALSAFTSLKMRRRLDKGNFEIIWVDSFANAMAAVSARHLAEKKNAKIVFFVAPNSLSPKGIPSELRHDIDAWVFPSTRLKDAFPQDLHNCVIIPAADINDDIESSAAVPSTDVNSLLWVAPLDENLENLKAAIEAVDKAADDVTLTICGTGKAQKVMPAVRLSRAITHPGRIEWVGDNQSIIDLAQMASTIVQGGAEPTNIEAALAAAGWNLMRVSDINREATASITDWSSREKALEDITTFFLNLR